MINEKDLYKYILRRFLLSFVVIAVLQIVCNMLLTQGIAPIMKIFLGTSRFTDIDLLGSVMLVFGMLLSRVLSPSIAYNMIHFLDKILNLKLGDAVLVTDFKSMADVAGSKGFLYLIMLISSCIIMIILWITPYIIGAVMFATKVLDKVKALEKQRLEENIEAEKQKNLLLSDIAHDIKTPITTIAGFSQALVEGQVEEDKKQEYLEAINTKSMQTVDMVTLLFEYVKLDSEGYKLTKTTEDVCEIFRNSIATYYTDFEDKEMELDIDIPDEGIFLQVDRVQLQRVFNNLLVNAIKHNPEKTHMTMSVETLDKWISFKISDNGTWIESDSARYIFDPFVQGDKSRTGKKGTGLGLSITRKIVEMHGGRIRLIQYKERIPYTKTFEIQLRKQK